MTPPSLLSTSAQIYHVAPFSSPLRQTFLKGSPLTLKLGNQKVFVQGSRVNFVWQIGDHAVFPIDFGTAFHVAPFSLVIAPDTLWEPKER